MTLHGCYKSSVMRGFSLNLVACYKFMPWVKDPSLVTSTSIFIHHGFRRRIPVKGRRQDYRPAS
jgi:hypothetical protein